MYAQTAENFRRCLYVPWQGLPATPEEEGPPLMRHCSVVNYHTKLLSAAAEVLRYVILERGEVPLAQTMPAA